MHIPSVRTATMILCAAALLFGGQAGLHLIGTAASPAVEPLAQPPQLQEEGFLVIDGQPLRILVGPAGSLQVYHSNYESAVTFGTAGSGFYLADGETVYGPYFTRFTALRQAGPSGSGTPSSPFQVITEAQTPTGGPGLEWVQTISYINGENYFQLEWEITNNGPGRICFKAYHAADLFFADNDFGSGFYDPGSGAVGGFNADRDWFMVFIPTVPAAHFEEARYTTIWQRVENAADLQDTVEPDTLDNGAALQWDACLGRGASTTIGDLWSFGDSEAAVIHPRAALEGFRPPGLLTPEISTHIPTPLDLSLDPQVIGTNLFLAVLFMLLFTIASEILNRTLSENEALLPRLIKPLQSLQRLAERLSPGRLLGHPLWFELLKLAAVLGIYGLVFSLLEPGWKPLSLSGLFLFLTMLLAYGLVGLADDLAQWAAARHWKLPASLVIRPGNLLLIAASAAFSRLFGLLPGIMFGSPEAFEIDAAVLKDRRTGNALLRLAAGVLFLILLAAWLPTVLTRLMLRGGGPEFLLVLVGGLESFLLLIFAVTVQNIFLQMLTLPGTFGQALARWSKPAWAVGFLAAAFLLLHTLLNPQGDIAEALASNNLLFFLATICLFLAFTAGCWLFSRVVQALTPSPGGSPPSKKPAFWTWGLPLAFMALCLGLLAGALCVYFALRP